MSNCDDTTEVIQEDCMKSFTIAALAVSITPCAVSGQQVVTGQAAFADYSQQQPGIYRKITVADLPEPKPGESVDNGAKVVARPEGVLPIAPVGFKVSLYAGGDGGPTPAPDGHFSERLGNAPPKGTFQQPRIIRTAPNGDIFLSDSFVGTIFVLRGIGPDGKAQVVSKYATGLKNPFGIAFYPAHDPKYVYIANTYTVVRFPYHCGDLVALTQPETVVADLPGYAQLRGGGHWTRDVVFTRDGSRMLISVGSASNADNADEHPNEFHRADVLEFTPEGKFIEVYASGLRNCVGEAINPVNGELWCSTNERDNLGNNLVPDYITSVREGGFYGWPWYYMGGRRDPRLPLPCANGTGANLALKEPLTPDESKACEHVDLASRVITPDVLIQPHMASLEMAFYTPGRAASEAFPKEFTNDAFAAEHGSWNRASRGGYEVVRVPMHDGHATGAYEDFLTGFVMADGQVWGRPVGVTVMNDGSLLVCDDGSRTVWRVRYVGNEKRH
jgi:glucose/arabinose dehydrogenase